MLLFRIRKGVLWGALVSLLVYNTYGIFRLGWWHAFTVPVMGVALAFKIYDCDHQPVANHRALKLLFAHLTSAQRREFALHGYFHVQGSDGRTYQIRDRSFDNVRESSWSFCAYPVGLPKYDCLLAQKLLIETNVRHFKASAFSHHL